MKIYNLRKEGSTILYGAGTNGNITLVEGGGSSLASSAGNGLTVYANKLKLGGGLTEHTQVGNNNLYDFTVQGRNLTFVAASSTTFFSAAPVNYQSDVSGNYTNRSLVDKEYVNLASIRYVRARATANLTSTYNNGAFGIGATLTATTNVVLPAQDGITLIVGDRIAIFNQTSGFQNGIYVVSSVGVNAVSPWILTRATDYDTAVKIYNTKLQIKEGTTFNNTTYDTTNTSSAITVGTTVLTYGLNAGYNFGTGLTTTGKTITIANGTITRNMLTNGAGFSVIGRSATGTGSVGDIVAGSDGQVLKRVGGVLGFNSLGFNDLPFQVLANSYSSTGTATTTFTVSIGQTLANTTYKVNITPSNLLSSALLYVNNKTTTTFDVVYQAGLTGAVAFDWQLYK